ncbi:hypothetical protein HZC32_03150 [Candidatus Woesearchaeota archaeon]|nr:hypothetical protein [Candidatus Woesearchaeota archaeon]
MQDQDRILQFLVINGPSLPTKVAKVIHSEILIASAHLSDLSAQGKVKISSLKVGGSPLYYLAGQEEKLYDFAQNNLNPQDFRVLNLLKEKKVLRERELDLLSKVALRELKDFAFPLHVTSRNKTEMFWKWHLLPDEETNQMIKVLLVAERQPLPSIAESSVVPSLINVALPAIAGVKPEPLSDHQREEKIEAIWKKVVQEEPKEGQRKLETEEIPGLVEKKPRAKKERIEKVEKPIRKRIPVQDEFLPWLEEYFKSKKIIIEQKEVLRKNAEINLLLKVPSVVGSLTYYCKAKKKIRCDEKDLSFAYMEAQIKKLPLLFLYTNELNKKVQEMLETGAFENTIVKKIE